jgi:hypothetical protein
LYLFAVAGASIAYTWLGRWDHAVREERRPCARVRNSGTTASCRLHHGPSRWPTRQRAMRARHRIRRAMPSRWRAHSRGQGVGVLCPGLGAVPGRGRGQQP